jgi:hypothetical protein
MSDIDLEPDEQEREPLDPKIREELRQARADRKALNEMKAENEAIKRESAGAKAGLPDTAGAKFFLKHYDGELSTDAIRSAAQEIGILNPPPAEDPAQEAELAALRRAQSGVRESGDPEPEAEGEYFQRVAGAKNKGDVIAAINDAQKRGLPVRLAQ